MKNQAVIELWAIVEVDEKLDWYNIVIEVFNENISDFAKNSRHSFLLETLNKELMINSNKFRHNVNNAFTNNRLLRGT